MEEGISNAIRHGEAANISIALSPMQDGRGAAVQVVIVDDGKGLMPGNAGMGTALLDQACPGHWTLTQNAEGGCTLSATIQRVATGMP